MSKAFDGVPQLFRNFKPAFGPESVVDSAESAFGDALPPWSGPRSWWGGPLDVEGLALGAVGAAAAVLNLLAGAPGRFTTTAALTAGAFDSSGHLRINGRKIQGFAPLSGFRRTQDGWIRLHATGYGVAAAAIALLARRLQTGLGGGARFSLVRTAEELFALPALDTAGMASLLPKPELGTMASTYGELRYALPPLLVAGRPLDYTAPPVPYGRSAPAWF